MSEPTIEQMKQCLQNKFSGLVYESDYNDEDCWSLVRDDLKNELLGSGKFLDDAIRNAYKKYF